MWKVLIPGQKFKGQKQCQLVYKILFKVNT